MRIVSTALEKAPILGEEAATLACVEAYLQQVLGPTWVGRPEIVVRFPFRVGPKQVRREWPSWHWHKPPRPTAHLKGALSSRRLFSRASPSVYWVFVTNGRSASQGSAVAVGEHVLLTACHVVAEAGAIAVGQKGTWARARVVAADPGTDRCWLYSARGSFIPVVGLRTFDSLSVGEKVYSLGAPRGFEATLGPGVISGKRQGSLIQTTAPMSPGSSGGGLFDAYGHLVAITTMSRVDSQSLNFGISADMFWE